MAKTESESSASSQSRKIRVYTSESSSCIDVSEFQSQGWPLIPPKHVCIRAGGSRCRSRGEEGWATMKLLWDRDELIPETPQTPPHPAQYFEPPCFLACSGTPSGSCPQSLKMVCHHSIPSDAAGFRASERAAGVQGSPLLALPREAGSLVPTSREPLRGVCVAFASSQGAVPPRLRLSLPSPCPPHRHYKEKTTESFGVPLGFKPG